MIRRASKLTLRRLSLAALHVHEFQWRYPERLAHYIGLLEQNDAVDDDLGVIHVKPCEEGGYEILDGHHRFCALVMCGREDALCLVIDESTSASTTVSTGFPATVTYDATTTGRTGMTWTFATRPTEKVSTKA